MNLSDIIRDPEAVIALEPDELGLLILPLLDAWGEAQLDGFIRRVRGPDDLPSQAPGPAGCYPRRYKQEIATALREAWAWLIGAALLVPQPCHVRGSQRLRPRQNSHVIVSTRTAHPNAQSRDVALIFCP